MSEERVELSSLALQIDVSQATLYRWFGSREQLLDQVLGQLADEFAATAIAEAEGEGDARVLDMIRHLLSLTIDLAPVRSLIAREPQIALRLLLGEDQAVHRSMVRAINQIVAEARSPEEADALRGEIETIVQAGAALQWATLAAGDQPNADRVVAIARGLLSDNRA